MTVTTKAMTVHLKRVLAEEEEEHLTGVHMTVVSKAMTLRRRGKKK